MPPRRAARRVSLPHALVFAMGAAMAMATTSPLEAQAITDSLTVSYELDGLRILHRRTSSRVFAANLYLLGGARQVTKATAGIEPFLLLSSEYGTLDYPGEEVRRAAARTGSSITVEADEDWTTYTMSGVREQFDSTWAVFMSRLLRPTLDSAAIGIVRPRMLAAARRQRSSPDVQVAVLAESLAFIGHPYALDPNGTEESIAALAADDLRAYARDQLVKSRMLLVVVGDIPRERLDELVARTIGTLPKGDYSWTMPPAVRATAPAIALAQRKLTTNYILGYIHGPQISSPDYPAFEYAMMILGNFVSSVIREREGLSYAADVPMLQRGVSGAAIFVSTARPDTVVKLINSIFDWYEDDVRISGSTLRRVAESYKTSYLLGMETAGSHADMLARAQLYQGDYRAAAQRAEVMGKVKFPEIRRIIKTYGTNIQYAFVGDSARMPRTEMMKR
ncbi:MAG: M16 family metallopeptidase [Gemmatimonadaceae bacterium]